LKFSFSLVLKLISLNSKYINPYYTPRQKTKGFRPTVIGPAKKLPSSGWTTPKKRASGSILGHPTSGHFYFEI
jgi:hypothetical protein